VSEVSKVTGRDRPGEPDFRALFESAPGLYLVLDPALVIVAVSEAYLRATMTERPGILGRGIFDVFPDNPGDPEATGVRNLRASLQTVLEQRRPDAMALQKYDIRRPASEGGGFEERHWSPLNSPVLRADGTLTHIIHQVEDVTDFVRLEQKGLEQQAVNEGLQRRVEAVEHQAFARAQQLAAIVDASDDAIIGKTLDGVITTWNLGARRIFGYSAEEIVGSNITRLIPADRLEEETLILGDLSAGRVRRFDTVRLRKDGQPIDVSVTSSPVRDASGKVIGISKVARDITAEKRTERELERATALAEATVRELDALRERAGRLRAEDQLRREHAGRKDAEGALGIRNNLYSMLSRTHSAICFSRSRGELYREICAIAVEAGAFRFAWVGEPDGESVERVASAGDDAAMRAGCTSSASFPLKERGRVAAVLSLYADAPGLFTGERTTTLNEIATGVSTALDRFVDEQERQKSEARLHVLDRAVGASSQGIIVADARLADVPVIYASPGCERLTGYPAEALVGKNCRMLQGPDTDPASRLELREAIGEGRSCTVELLNYRKDGTPFWNHVAISPVRDAGGRLTHFVGVQTDVTERRQLESQFRQAQKMEAVGRLAGGVAHDFNNILSVILSYAEMVLGEVEAGSVVSEDMSEIMKAGKRAADLTRQLLLFSRQQVLEPRVLDLNELLEGMEKMLQRLLGEDLELVTAAAASPAMVRVDPGSMEQVIMNLVVNARDAMPYGGKLRITTDTVDVEPAFAEHHADMKSGPHVRLAVRARA
jgi:PAS domain S-box-containing protein